MGLGPVPGTLALTIGTATFMAKLIGDALEEVQQAPREGVSATGASRVQEFISAVLPQALPNLVSQTLYMLDVNLRSSTVLGIVGGGGIAQRQAGDHAAAAATWEPLLTQVDAATATSLRIRDGKTVITDGPFAETKEQLAGFYLVDAHDLNEAIQIASGIPAARVGSVEVRPIRQLDV